MLLPRLMQRVGRETAVLLLIGFFSLLPASGHAFSIGEEQMIGEQLLYAVRSKFELLDDPDISQYINGLGRQVLDVAGPQYFDYHFFVIKNEQFNAFSAPSGLIFFNTGLLKTIKNEDQLVSVMAHEVAHVTCRHISSRMAKQTKVSAVSLLVGLASLAAGNPALTQGMFAGALAAGSTAGLSFSRQDEEEADRLAVEWLRRMGRNPAGMEGMLKIMRRITRYSSEQLPPYLLTHPNPEDRLHYVQSLIEADRGNSSPKAETNNFAFLRFKYRVLSQALEPDQLRAVCVSDMKSGDTLEDVAFARYGLALLSAEDNDFREAVSEMDLVRQEYPQQHILDIDLASLYFQSNQTDKALELLRRAHQHNPTDMYAAFRLAQAEEKKGNAAEAERLYLATAKAMPEYPQSYYALGRLKDQQKKTGTSNFYLAKYHLYEGRMDYAKQYLHRAEKDKTVPPGLREEAKAILERLKKLEDA